ncbi:hypothetical protein A3A76_04695 [Candidatus Woesebacteria bacterium RIFCSPLOWO2_01_FULL_39_23]|uniref:Uncharacterized protein n=2 Tax=Microgenomates group TaxID=1794810 RepID=A0A0H4T664_9BACT|nr:hypothetical protein [uncultured Microgenomates bacterium Rifle_16ft_4_minimus_37633]OGM13782.1 MAG: hypothetical protein A2141_03920 [Candidatus Woesebacteria bacterium RBG_16_40_11]OGM27732.1 MAG: hypothetical protein A2628_04915 [Candidatus Woesebacteria bacterium RIFCSPHIGHO2_01_FULL_40_22]OGM38675.1 MAG: hypothetical protein A3E41_00100 [Candidatus Woesebacteria bacterium RIFCSPHIGHO2_12_FULL_38_9]OGM62154.1 MAG: hypothetical protein A3A76_04695 [Candidatus Woesebacteria bacterium RIFCS
METVFNQSIWGDEGFSAILSMKSLPDIIKVISRDTSPPLWNIIEHFAFQIFGASEVVIRSLSFSFYLITAFFVFKIGSLLFSKKSGGIVVLLTLFNPFFFIYAFEGRMYSIMAAGVTASMYFYLKIFFGEGGKGARIGYTIATLWALYSHHFAFFAVATQGFWWLYEFLIGHRERAKRVFKTFLLIGLGYLPWVYPLYTQTKMVGGGFWLGTPTPSDFGKMIFEYLAEGIRNDNLKLPLLNIPLHQAALYVVFASLAVRKWWKSIKKTVILLLWFVGPIVLTWLISQKFQSIFYNRYLLYTIPAAMIILASARSKISIIPLTALIILFGIIDYQYFTHPTKLPFKEYSAYVKSVKKEGDYLINWNSSSHHLWETKFYGIPAPIYIPAGGGDLPFFVGTALMEKDDIIRTIPKTADQVGIITSGPVSEINIPGYSERDVKSFGNLKFILYDK